MGSVLAVILAASSIGNEYNWRTIRIALISSESRFKFLGAKLISIAIIILIGMVIGLATGFVMGLITTAIGGNSFDFSFATGGYFWDQFLQFWRTFFVILPFMLLGFLFALVGRSAMPGIAIGIGILFLEPIITSFMGLAGGWVAKIPDYLFNANVNAINALNKLPIPGGFSGVVIGSSSNPFGISCFCSVVSLYRDIHRCCFLFISKKGCYRLKFGGFYVRINNCWGWPAGMTAAVYSARKLLNTFLIAKDIGGQVMWTSSVENYMGYQVIESDELIARFQKQVDQFPVVQKIGVNVTQVKKINGGFEVTADSGEKFQGQAVILASGKRPRRLNIPGEMELTGRGVTYCSIM